MQHVSPHGLTLWADFGDAATPKHIFPQTGGKWDGGCRTGGNRVCAELRYKTLGMCVIWRRFLRKHFFIYNFVVG
jgi:hypothetical protein